MAQYWRFVTTHYVKHGRPTAEQGSIKCARRPLKELYVTTVANEFGPLALKAVRQKMVDAGLARGTINQNVGRIRRMFKWAAAEELLSFEVYQRLTAVTGLQKGRTEARETAPILPVDDAVVQATLPHLSAVVVDMIRFELLTGCRPGELCAIRPDDVDTSGNVWAYRPSEHKTEHHSRQRVVFIGPQAQDVLRPYLLRDKQTHCFSPAESEAKRLAEQHEKRKTPLSCGNRPGTNRKSRPKRTVGNCDDTNSYRKAIHRACDVAFPAPPPLAQRDGETKTAWLARLSESELAELREWQKAHRWAPNRLRHARATDLRKKFGIESARVVLGHSDAAITQVYAERDLEAAAEIAAQVG